MPPIYIQGGMGQCPNSNELQNALRTSRMPPSEQVHTIHHFLPTPRLAAIHVWLWTTLLSSRCSVCHSDSEHIRRFHCANTASSPHTNSTIPSYRTNRILFV